MKRSKDTAKAPFLGIREIAQIAGVSTATVSRVINHPERCSEKTRVKVEETIKKYNYIPNESIKHIFSRTSNMIAIFILDIKNPFYSSLIMELNNICFQKHYTLLICDTENDIEKEKTYLEMCLAKRCAGIILTEGISHRLFDNIEIPIVALDRQDQDSNIPLISSENYHAVRKAVKYLYNLEHRRIAFVGPDKNTFLSVETRFQGYTDELAEKKLSLEPAYVFREGNLLTPGLGKDALHYFLSLSLMPTAILCANDMIALGVINEALLLNISIPDDLSVCGFDHVIDDFLFMPLTTVEQNIGMLALALFEAVTDPSYDKQQATLESVFLPGKTCTRAPKED